MNVSLELMISIVALVISICSFSSNRCKCDKPTTTATSDGTDTTKEWAFFLACVLATALILQILKIFFAVIGLVFPIGGYLMGSCFASVFFTFWYYDDHYFHFFHPAASNKSETSDGNLITAKDWQSAQRAMLFISIGAFIVLVVATLIKENICC